jgi:uncharacterized membrane protein
MIFMRQKNILNTFISGLVGFIVFVLVSLLFKKLNFFNFENRSFTNIVVEGLIVSICFSILLFIKLKRRIKQ